MNKINLEKKKIIEREFNFNFKKEEILRLDFLDNFSKTKVFVSKKSGLVFHNDYQPSLTVVEEWSNKIFSNKTDIKNKTYTDNNPGMSSRHFLILEFLISKFKQNLKNKRIIDYGCGQGGLILKAKKYFKFNNLTGLEHSKKNISLIKKRFKKEKLKKPKLFQSTIENFKNSQGYDLGFLTWTLCNCSEPLEIVKSISKSLKKNGYLVVAESSRILVPFKKPIFNYFNPKKKSAYTHPWHWSINSLSNVFKFYGFEVILTNDYFNENDLIIILKNSKKYNQDFEFDDTKKVINFFKRWKKESLFYKNLK